MDKKILAVLAVAILLVAGVAVFIAYKPDSTDDGTKEYDPTKGWYSWDPVVMDYGTSELTSSPNLLKATEKMYQAIYGDLPDYSKYPTAPADFLKFESKIVKSDDTSITVKSSIRIDKDTSTYETLEVTIPKKSNHMLTVASNAALLKLMLENEMTSEQAEAKVWEIVYGLDKSAFPGESSDIKKNYNMTIPEGVEKVPSTWNLVDNIDKYTEYVEDCTKTADDNLIIMVSGGFKQSYADMKPFLDMLNAASPGHAYLVGTFSPDLSSVFATMEILGAMFDLKDTADHYIDDIRAKFYAMSQEADKKDVNYKVYVESTNGQGAGKGTIANDIVTTVLGLKNICSHSQWQKISDEIVVEKQPHVLIFQSSDKRTDAEKMRIGTGLETS